MCIEMEDCIVHIVYCIFTKWQKGIRRGGDTHLYFITEELVTRDQLQYELQDEMS